MKNHTCNKDIQPANRVSQVKEYYFSKKLKEVAEMNARGENVISLGVGSPDLLPSKETLDALHEDSLKIDANGYMPYVGIAPFRKTYSEWYKKWYGVDLNPDTEMQPLIGSKEGIMHITLDIVNPGDKVLVPDPGYPTYYSVCTLAEAEVSKDALTHSNDWLTDF